ncbi:hypothetical protein SB775_30595, partial [Peribacillus sp. SIMBA_075]|uniref:hypothetical protein n=1 Tax=Peribacillus sp. SIMBA_075 TaxID=3085813 RepID=UPI00397E2946
MAQQHINFGTLPTGIGGDTRYAAFRKCDDNFTELYAAQAQLVDDVGDLQDQLTALAPSDRGA